MRIGWSLATMKGLSLAEGKYLGFSRFFSAADRRDGNGTSAPVLEPGAQAQGRLAVDLADTGFTDPQYFTDFL